MATTRGEDLLLKTLGDFTSKENWDSFFTIKGAEDPFEWYAEWPSLRGPLLAELSATDLTPPLPLQILVPGCGNSRLSEHLYDAGFRGITNVDFSKVVVSEMLRRNIRARPEMRWRVMDMTQMQFADETFEAVLDKGGLDALMEPELGPKLGAKYLSEVKRVLKSGGKFVCLTLAESHVLGLLFSKFRFGWKINIHALPHKASNQPSFQTFMVVVVREQSTMLHEITSLVNSSSLDCDNNQVRGLFETLESENKLRKELSSGADILYSLEDLHLGAKGDLKVLAPGRRFQLVLGEEGGSVFSYKAVLLDAKEQLDAFIYQCGVFLVPKIRAHEWLFSSEEGQWLVVESSKAARLIMVFLDARHSNVSMDEIQKDLSPLVKDLAPRDRDSNDQIPFMMANDGVKQRAIVHQVTSPMTGQITVEDVIYEKVDGSLSSSNSSKERTFRRLVFQRNLGVLQSEALLTEGCPDNNLVEKEKRKTNSMSKLKKKGRQKSSAPITNGSKNTLKVDHQYLASSYHTGIVSGFMLVAFYLERMASSMLMAKTVVIGLGAGLLPMFLRGCIPCLNIEVVELDPKVLNLARDYFEFIEDEQLKVHVADGIEFVRRFGNSTAPPSEKFNNEDNKSISKEKFSSANRNCADYLEGKKSSKIDILIIDVDSFDTSSGMNCPHPDFVEESFLLSVKEALSEEGLFVINLVSRSPSVREMVVSRIKAVFSHLFCLQIEEDVNEVLLALPSPLSISEDYFSEAALQLQKLLKLTEERNQDILSTTKKIKHLM
ncbi:hypothetical protein Syun_030520 [Stephania yunnanensis]|uniref:Methyltransferase type 11 domain-containing protein n=1 Tax=Stephania yunnanensis TaxID=152371 RepID=A0AAP0DXV1_9MAGN